MFVNNFPFSISFYLFVTLNDLTGFVSQLHLVFYTIIVCSSIHTFQNELRILSGNCAVNGFKCCFDWLLDIGDWHSDITAWDAAPLYPSRTATGWRSWCPLRDKYTYSQSRQSYVSLVFYTNLYRFTTLWGAHLYVSASKICISE